MNQQNKLKVNQNSLDKPTLPVVGINREISITLVSVDRVQMVRPIVSLIKSLGIEKEVLRILRGY